MSELEKRLMKHIDLLVERYPSLESEKNSIISAYLLLEECYVNGGKLLVAGNGGSAADAEHIVGELMKGFKRMKVIDGGGWLSMTIKLFIFIPMLSAPRSAYDGFIAQILNINHFLYVLLIYMFARYFRLRSKN